jgi:hypothetical protein
MWQKMARSYCQKWQSKVSDNCSLWTQNNDLTYRLAVALGKDVDATEKIERLELENASLNAQVVGLTRNVRGLSRLL